MNNYIAPADCTLVPRRKVCGYELCYKSYYLRCHLSKHETSTTSAQHYPTTSSMSHVFCVQSTRTAGVSEDKKMVDDCTQLTITTQQTQNLFITLGQRWTNVEDFGQTLNVIKSFVLAGKGGTCR